MSVTDAVEREVEQFMEGVRTRSPHEGEFHQAVEEVARSVMPYYLDHERYRRARLLERLTEPDRIVSFRVTWEDDQGAVHVHRAWRVQFSQALGPYKGGFRFHPTVNQSVLKFLGFEQVFKNSLTGLSMGGGKGGSTFSVKGRSEREVMRFCQSLMTELYRHVGESVDVPAGDIGLGEREIGFLFGQYLRLVNRWTGVLTSKARAVGGSAGRAEATGYGCVYFLESVLEHRSEGLAGKRVAISGSGNVALHAAEKLLEKEARVLTLSDSDGFVHFGDQGLDASLLERIKALKLEQRGRLSELDGEGCATFHAKERPWGVPCEIALPCATQNEIEASHAKALVNNGVEVVCEGANMPLTAGAVAALRDRAVVLPGKAANAGGVAVSGLEMSQNAQHLHWEPAEVERRLESIMHQIHARCAEHGEADGEVDYIRGANVAGFARVARALHALGLV